MRQTRASWLQRWWYLPTTGIFSAGIFLHQIIFLWIGLIPLLLLISADLWYSVGLRHLVVQQHLSQRHAFCGDTIIWSTTVANEKRLPLPWLVVQTDIPKALQSRAGLVTAGASYDTYALRTPFVLAPHQHVTHQALLECRQRGIYRITTAQVTSSDPLGWRQRQQSLDPLPQEVIVYPRLVPLDDLRFSVQTPFGELPTARRLLDDPVHLAGIREYAQGDDPRRINWKASARHGTLQSNVYRWSGQHRIIALLDLQLYGSVLGIVDDRTFERIISLGASMAQWALDHAYTVGMLSNGAYYPYGREAPPQDLFWLPPTNRYRQREYIFEGLARLTPTRDRFPIESLVVLHRYQLSRGATLVVITAVHALRTATVAALLTLQQQGIDVRLFLVGDTQQSPSATVATLPVYRFAPAEEEGNYVATPTG